MARKYDNVVRWVAETPWAVLPSAFEVVRDVIAAHLDGRPPDPDRFAERRAQAEFAFERAQEMSGGGVAVLPVHGMIVPRATLFTEMSGGTSTEEIGSYVRAAVAEPSISAIVLDIDSPGGMAQGLPELAAEIRSARAQKPVHAVVNKMAASAAYWIASQADDLAVAPSGELGSIGVFAAHTDTSQLEEKLGVKTTLVSAGKYKTEGNPFEPLSEEARAAMQAKIDAIYAMFVADVVAGRGTTTARVRGPQFGEGRMLLAHDAVEQKMADRVATLEETVRKAARSRPSARATRAVFDVVPAAATGLPPVEYAATAGTYASGTGIADRRPRMVTDEEEIEMESEQETTPTSETPAVEASPRAVDPARDELNQTVHDLSEAVRAFHDGRGDRDKIDALQDEVMELRKALDERDAKSGYLPGDDQADRVPTGVDVIAATWERSTKAAAAVIGRPEADVTEFREKADNLLLLAAAMKKDPRELKYYSEHYLPAMAAIDTQTTAEGKEFVPTILSADLIPRIELGLRVAALFRQIDMPSNPYEIPGFGVSRVRGGKHAEQTADTGQTGFKKVTPATRKVTLAAQKFAAEVLVSKEEEEDSLIPILGFLRAEITSQLAFDVEDAIVNGDAQGPHMDADVTAADDPRKIWDGLRNLVQAGQKTDGSAASVDAAKLRVNRKKMGKYGVDSSKIVTIMSIGGYVNMLADANVLTVDKYGPSATIHTGELASVDGIPIIVSQFVRDDLNATGVYDGTTTTKTIAITVNPDAFLIGNRRALTVQVLNELYAEYDQDAIAVSMRKAFASVYPSSEAVLSLTYNLNS